MEDTNGELMPMAMAWLFCFVGFSHPSCSGSVEMRRRSGQVVHCKTPPTNMTNADRGTKANQPDEIPFAD
jgi:hypothetical protein